MERTLYEIAGAVGTPLLIDNVTRNILYGHYARILVDMDLSKTIFYEVMVEREGYAFPVAVEYEGLPDFCTHCKSIGHDITSCRWLHPRRADTHEQLIDKGKQPVHSQKPKQGWKPKDNPEGIGSSKAFATVASTQHDATVVPVQQDVSRVEPSCLADSQHDDMEDLVGATVAPSQHKETIEDTAQLAAFQPIDKNVTVATFSIEFQNDVDKTPHDRLPSTSIHVLEKIFDEVHVDVKSHEVEYRHLASQVHEIPLADVSQPTFVVQDDMQGTGADFQSSYMEHNTPPTPLQIQSEAHQSINLQHAEVNSNEDAEVQILKDQSQTSQVPIAQTHTSKNIQSGLELWARIWEYNQRTAEEGFTQVLTKKQQQARKKKVLGKPHYTTRARGGPPPTAQ